MSEGSSSLTVLGGKAAGQRYVLPPTGDAVIGSHASCAVVIAAFGVSPQHAVLRIAAQAVTVHDLGSPSGVFVNDVRVAGERALAPGDVLWLGPPGGQGSVGLSFQREEATSASGEFFVTEETIAGEAKPAGAPTAVPPASTAEDEVFFVGESAAIHAAAVAPAPAPMAAEVAEDAFFVEEAATGGASPGAAGGASPVEDAFFVGDSPTVAAPGRVPAPAAPPAPPAHAPSPAQAAPEDEFFVEEAAPPA